MISHIVKGRNISDTLLNRQRVREKSNTSKKIKIYGKSSRDSYVVEVAITSSNLNKRASRLMLNPLTIESHQVKIVPNAYSQVQPVIKTGNKITYFYFRIRMMYKLIKTAFRDSSKYNRLNTLGKPANRASRHRTQTITRDIMNTTRNHKISNIRVLKTRINRRTLARFRPALELTLSF